MRRPLALLAALAATAAAAPAAQAAAKRCDEPGASWQRATPAEAGFDAAKLQATLDEASRNASYAVRVYRNGCLAGQDRGAALNEEGTYESWSMAKSVASLAFGRAMTMGLISPDDPVGSLIPEADAAHGAVTMRQLLTMTSGVEWNGLRDYNIFTMPDRVRDWLTLPFAHPPGTYYEYAQSAVAVLTESVRRAVGQDADAFLQEHLLAHLGVKAGTWRWEKDRAGHVQGFYGVNMRVRDFARMGELMRRGGMWNGRRLLSQRYVREALAPTETNGCYGWLIWVNSGKPCIGPRVSERGVSDGRDYPELPADLFRFSGLFGQLVAVFPTQGVVVARTGQDPGLVPAGGQGWELKLYKGVLDALTDTKVERPADDATGVPSASKADSDAGFQDAIRNPDRYKQGLEQDPLPAAGPRRARALRMRLAHLRPSRTGVVTLRVTCPALSPAACEGRARLQRTARSAAYSIAPGATRILRFRLNAKARRTLRADGRLFLPATAVNSDAAGGTPASIGVSVRR